LVLTNHHVIAGARTVELAFADDPEDRDTAAGASVPVLVVRSREDQEIAREVRRLLVKALKAIPLSG
jgi:S1-C subfamily serine protease